VAPAKESHQGCHHHVAACWRDVAGVKGGCPGGRNVGVQSGEVNMVCRGVVAVLGCACHGVMSCGHDQWRCQWGWRVARGGVCHGRS
jgi:hypothetical protein